MINKNKISLILRFAISFGLLVALIWIMRKDAKNIIHILKDSNKLFFILALLINIPLSVALAYRLKLLMTGQKMFLSLKDSIYLTFIGYFFNNFLPTAIGGDIVKAYYASKKIDNKPAAYAAVLTDRLLGFFSTILIGAIGLIFIGKDMDNNYIIWIMPIALFLFILAVFVFINKKDKKAYHASPRKGILNILKEKLIKVSDAIGLYKHRPVLLIKALLLSVLLQAFSIVTVYFFILCIGGDIHPLKLFLIIPLVWAISMLPSLNGLGVREGAFVYLLKGHIGQDKAFAISILWLGVVMFYSLVGGLLHLLYPVGKTS